MTWDKITGIIYLRSGKTLQQCPEWQKHIAAINTTNLRAKLDVPAKVHFIGYNNPVRTTKSGQLAQTS